LEHAEKLEMLYNVQLDDVNLADIRSLARTDITAAKMYQMKQSKAANCVVQ